MVGIVPPQFEIRMCPALMKKPMPPKLPEEVLTKDEKKHGFNPFLPPYVPTMDLGPIVEEDEEYEALVSR